MRSSGRSTAAPSWPPCRRTRRCPPRGWPSSTTCRPPTWPRRSRRWPQPGSSSRGPGPLGGYRLARPPADISLLDIVLAVDGDGPAFRCSEIRQRGPAATAGSPAYRRPCGIARVMWRAEDAWRAELAAVTVGDIVTELFGDRARRAAGARGRVDPGSRRTTKEQDMKVFVAGATGVLGRATVPRLVAAGHEVRGAARSPEKADQLRAQGAEPVTVDLFDPASVRAAVDGCQGVVHMATNIPPLTKGWKGDAWATNDRLRREGTRVLADACRDAGVRGAGEGDGVVLLRGRRRPVDRRGLAHRAPALQRRVARRRGHHARLHRRRPPRRRAALRPLLLPRRPGPRGEPEDRRSSASGR